MLDRTNRRCYYQNINPSEILGIKRGDGMKLSTKGRYGLRAMIDLVTHAETEPVSIASIAARQHISESYLEQLIAKLRKAGLVTSVRGAGGGYVPGCPADEMSVGDVLRALEGNLNPVECAGITGDGSCGGSDVCVTKYVWKKINDSINHTVDEIKISDLVKESREVHERKKTPGSCCEKKE